MATGSPSTWVRRQALSQGRGQTRPMMRGSGRRCFDDPDRLGVVSAGDGGQVGGYVDAGRTGVVAGRFAVGVVVGEELVQPQPAGLRDPRDSG